MPELDSPEDPEVPLDWPEEPDVPELPEAPELDSPEEPLLLLPEVPLLLLVLLEAPLLAPPEVAPVLLPLPPDAPPLVLPDEFDESVPAGAGPAASGPMSARSTQSAASTQVSVAGGAAGAEVVVAMPVRMAMVIDAELRRAVLVMEIPRTTSGCDSVATR